LIGAAVEKEGTKEGRKEGKRSWPSLFLTWHSKAPKPSRRSRFIVAYVTNEVTGFCCFKFFNQWFCKHDSVQPE
jgi:hypothetical protein